MLILQFGRGAVFSARGRKHSTGKPRGVRREAKGGRREARGERREAGGGRREAIDRVPASTRSRFKIILKPQTTPLWVDNFLYHIYGLWPRRIAQPRS